MNLFIRHVPDNLHKRLKITATEKGIKLYELVIAILEGGDAGKEKHQRPRRQVSSTIKPE